MGAFFKSSVFWGIIGLIGGILTSYVFFRLSRKEKILSCDQYSTTLITDNLSKMKGLRITFAGEPISDLVSTSLRLNNVGGDTIESTDLAVASPLQMRTTGKFMVLEDANSFLISSEKSCSFKLVQIDSQTIRIEFDYLGVGDEVYIKAFHTGDLTLTGDLKRGKIIYYDLEEDKKRLRRSIKRARILSAVAAIVAVLTAVYMWAQYNGWCLFW